MLSLALWGPSEQPCDDGDDGVVVDGGFNDDSGERWQWLCHGWLLSFSHWDMTGSFAGTVHKSHCGGLSVSSLRSTTTQQS